MDPTATTEQTTPTASTAPTAPILPVLDISNGIDATNPVFSADAVFAAAAHVRRDEMIAFMTKLGVSQMRTQLLDSQGTLYRLLVHM